MTVPVDILAIGAHPDDAEVGCGGTLILATDAGLSVVVADLTLGEAATRGTPEEREDERRLAARILGLESRPTLGLPDGKVGADPEHREAVIRLVREVQPLVVLAPYPEDRHPDHAAAGRLARDGAFLAGLPRSSDGPAHRPVRVYHYMLHQPFPPSFVVDISSVWDRKGDAIRAHRSQFGSVRDLPGAVDPGRFLEVVAASATLHGAMIGVERGEPFHYPGPVPLDALPGPWMRKDEDGPVSGYQIFH